MYNEYDVIEELKKRSKSKGLELSEEDLRNSLEQIAKETAGLSLTDSIRKLHKMLEEDSKNEWIRTRDNRDL